LKSGIIFRRTSQLWNILKNIKFVERTRNYSDNKRNKLNNKLPGVSLANIV